MKQNSIIRYLAIIFLLVAFSTPLVNAQEKPAEKKINKLSGTNCSSNCCQEKDNPQTSTSCSNQTSTAESQDETKMMNNEDQYNHSMINNIKRLVKTGDQKIYNIFCPVTGNEVDPDSPTVEYKGKIYGFCCPGCDDKFVADPEKYLKNLSEDGKIFLGKKS